MSPCSARYRSIGELRRARYLQGSSKASGCDKAVPGLLGTHQFTACTWLGNNVIARRSHVSTIDICIAKVVECSVPVERRLVLERRSTAQTQVREWGMWSRDEVRTRFLTCRQNFVCPSYDLPRCGTLLGLVLIEMSALVHYVTCDRSNVTVKRSSALLVS